MVKYTDWQDLRTFTEQFVLQVGRASAKTEARVAV